MIAAIVRAGLGPGYRSWLRWLELEATDPAFGSPLDSIELACEPCRPVGFWL